MVFFDVSALGSKFTREIPEQSFQMLHHPGRPGFVDLYLVHGIGRKMADDGKGDEFYRLTAVAQRVEKFE